jgi:hypothetical protein
MEHLSYLSKEILIFCKITNFPNFLQIQNQHIKFSKKLLPEKKSGKKHRDKYIDI